MKATWLEQDGAVLVREKQDKFVAYMKIELDPVDVAAFREQRLDTAVVSLKREIVEAVADLLERGR